MLFFIFILFLFFSYFGMKTFIYILMIAVKIICKRGNVTLVTKILYLTRCCFGNRLRYFTEFLSSLRLGRCCRCFVVLIVGVAAFGTLLSVLSYYCSRRCFWDVAVGFLLLLPSLLLGRCCCSCCFWNVAVSGFLLLLVLLLGQCS